MNKKIFLIGISIVLIICVFAQNKNKIFENFDKAWNEVEQLEKSAQPKSALKKIEKIEKEAKQLNNRQQQIKALIYKLKLQSEITEDAFFTFIPEVYQLRKSSEDEVEQAVLLSVLAQAYKSYYEANRYSISQRTALQGYVPEDMKEWSENIFKDTIVSLLKQSLLPAKKLQQTDATVYADVLEMGKDSRSQRPTMFDLLSYQALDLWPKSQIRTFDKDYFSDYSDFIEKSSFSDEKLIIYRNLIAFHLNDKNPDALVLSDLKRLEYVYDFSDLEMKDSLYQNSLDSLLLKFGENPVSVEIMEKIARNLLKERYRNCREEDFDPLTPRKVYEICYSGIKKFPKYVRIGLLKNILTEIEQKNIQVSASEIFSQEEPVRIHLHYANLKNPVITLWKYEMDPVAYQESSVKERQKFRRRIESRKLDLTPTNYYIQKDTVIEFSPKAFGIYGLSVTASSMKEQTADFRITSMANLLKEIPGSSDKELLVLDRVTGEPLSGVSAKLYKEKYNGGLKLDFLTQKTTDKDGYTVVSGSGNRRVCLSTEKGNDRYAPFYTRYFYKSEENDEKDKEYYVVFTDRGVYRPGQTVWFKCIAYHLEKEKEEVIPDKTIKVVLRDANYKQLAETDLKTNEFGSVASSFVLPENVKNGNFSIIVGNESKQIKVEEYKRPTFEIKLNKPEKTVSFGDTVSISGEVRALNGVIYSDSEVKYRILRQPDFFRIKRYFSGEKQVASGAVNTNADGIFSFMFIPEKEKMNCPENAYYHYLISVEVTDSNGESQTNEVNITVGDRSMSLALNLPEKMQIDSLPKLSVEAKNLNGRSIQTAVNCYIYMLKDVDKLEKETVNPNNLKREKQIWNGTVESGEKDFTSLKHISSSLKPGYYRFVLEAKDDKGRLVSDSLNSILYRKDDTKLPVKTHLWTETGDLKLSYGDIAKIKVGSSDKIWLYLGIQDKKGKSERKWIFMENEFRIFEIPFKEEYGDAMEINLFFMKNGRFYSKNIRFEKKQEKKDLKLQLSVFRNKLQPGENEEWVLRIPNLNGSAEVLTAMYDASLDKFKSNTWMFNPVYSPSVYFPSWNLLLEGSLSLYLNSSRDWEKVTSFRYDKFPAVDYVFVRGMGNGKYLRSKQAVMTSAPVMAESLSLSDNTVKVEESAEEDAASLRKENSAEEKGFVEEDSFRTNFAETAFFYPQLKTNENGEILIAFNVPETLTRWKFMGLAHSKDLYTGKIEQEVVTQKPFMIMPNLPRFLRQGDSCFITAKILNLSEKLQIGKVRLEMINPETEKILYTKIVDFEVDAEKTKIVSWTFTVPSASDLLVCRIIAKTDEMSDGEQKILPVLSDKVLITESMSMSIRGNQSRVFTFDNLKNNNSNTLQNRLLKLEFTASPEWYAVQALPAITVPESKNAFDLFGAYYGATLSEYIVRSNPRIETMVDIWKKQGATKETLLSDLKKNKELKNILLEETPWVLEAKNETEQKQRLSLLFDLNVQKENRSKMISKIRNLQNVDGSFSWYPDMHGSRYITMSILNWMSRLTALGALEYNNEEKQMQIKALNYLDKEVQKDYENLRKYSKDYKKAKITPSLLLYHLVRSSYKDIPIYGDALEANKFYYDLIGKQWVDFGLYERAMAALVLYRNGNHELAKKIINSLREYSTTTDEMGMYWDKNRSGYGWNESPIATHTAILESFAEIDPNTEELDEMCIWLLKQKQTQRWESVPATVDAVYALLIRGKDWLSSNNEITVKMGGEEIIPEEKEAGTGYFTKIFTGSDIKPELASVQVTKQSDAIAWGALYWQYQENFAQLEKAKTALHIEKKIMQEKVTKKGVELIPVTKDSRLKVGDKLMVRLIIRTDRDLDFVSLKDQRAACLEPVDQLSGYFFREGLGYYQSPKDASMQYFFDRLPKGTYVLEYPLWVTHKGKYTNGITTLQCLYAPEFISHTESVDIVVEE